RRSVGIEATAGTIGYGVLAISGLAVLRDFGITLSFGVLSSYLAARAVVAVCGHRESAPMAAAIPRRTPDEAAPIQQLEFV
ncbi:MAG TPA: hypothetical protein VN108_02755, partial [Marmoricola sp.]|nr:hypothetical protein [Marmoricola sp.]